MSEELLKKMESALAVIDSGRDSDDKEGIAISVIGKVLESLSFASRRQVIAHFQERYKASHIAITADAIRICAEFMKEVAKAIESKEGK
jgi:hypothetical protein